MATTAESVLTALSAFATGFAKSFAEQQARNFQIANTQRLGAMQRFSQLLLGYLHTEQNCSVSQT